MPAVKLPPVYDISHWIEVLNFKILDPLPWLIITKATEGDYFLDVTYGIYAEEIPAAGIRLGAYHFIRPGDPIAQADWFCEVVFAAGFRPDMILACDLEVTGVSLSQVKAFLDRVQLLTGIRPIIYSREELIESLYSWFTKNPPAWLKGEKLWIAEYTSNPDSVNEIPDWIVPAGLSKSQVVLFQYSDDGIIGGIPGNNVDLNLISPSYILELGLHAPDDNNNGGPTMDYYLIDPIDNTQSLTVRNLADPNIFGAGQGKINAGSTGKAYVDDVHIYDRDVIVSNVLQAQTGDKWVHVFEANGLTQWGTNGPAVDGWCAVVHKGKTYATLILKSDPTIPPPIDTGELHIDVDIVAGKIAGTVSGVAKDQPFNIDF